MPKTVKNIFSPEEGKKYFYYTQGDPKNPCIVIIPGYTGLHGDFLPLARVLQEKHFVIVPELPGWGKSSPLSPSNTLNQYANYLRDLLNYLKIKKVILVGHCMGAVTALEFCLHFPEMVTSVFLISNPYQDGMPSQGVFKRLVHWSLHVPKKFRPVFYIWRNRILAIILGFFIIYTKSMKKRLFLISRTYPQQAVQNEEVVEDNWRGLMEFSYANVKDLPIPLHIIHGQHDIVIPLSQEKKFLDFVPSATFDILAEAGHDPPLESPIALGRIILQYL